MMKIVMTPEDGACCYRQMAKYDKIFLSKYEFGELKMQLDCLQLNNHERNKLVDALNSVDDTINVYVDCCGILDFDYYMTPNVLPEIRAIVDDYCLRGAELDIWVYGGGQYR